MALQGIREQKNRRATLLAKVAGERGYMSVRVTGGREVSRRAAMAAWILVAAALVLGLSAGPAQATSFQRPFKEVFGTSQQPTFSNPQMVAVDPNTGDVLVADSGTNAITRYHADGTPAPFAALGSNKIDGQRGPGGHTRAECETAPEPESCDETPQNGLQIRSGGSAGGGAPQQIAIDGSPGPTNGDIYVTQIAENLVDIFSSAGRYLGQLTATNKGSLLSPCGLTVDADGALYVSVVSPTAAKREIAKFVPSGNPPVNADYDAGFVSTSPQGAVACNMAAGSGSSAGYLFIATLEGTKKVSESTGESTEFTKGRPELVAVDPTTGNPILGLRPSTEFDGSLAEATTPLSRLVPKLPPADFAVNASGEVYAVVGVAEPQVSVYGLPVVVATVTADAPTNVSGTKATLQGTVNPSGLEVTECFIEWGPTSSYGHKEPCEGGLPPTDSADHAVQLRISGLTPDGATYHFRVGAKDEHGTELSADRTFATAHTVVTEPASEIGTEAATINAVLRAEGTAFGSCSFEWGLADHAGYEHTAPCAPGTAELEAGFTAQPVSAVLTKLAPATAYRFRVTTDRGDGEPEEFTTRGAPRISEIRALNASQSSALLEARVDPSGFRTTYRFEWGPTAAYGNVLPAEFEPSVGSGTSPVLVTTALSGLSAGTSYHYRVVATSEAGTTFSPDQEVETLDSCGLPDHRCFELVSPRSLEPGAAPGRFGAGIEMHFQASDEPGSLAYVIEGGLSEATKGGEVLYQSSRTDGSGWSSKLLSPPTTVRNEQNRTIASSSAFLGLSPDLSCGVVGSPQPLTEDPVAELMDKAGGANLYLRSAAGSYELITDLPPEELVRQSGGLADEFVLIGMSTDCKTVVFSTENHYAGVAGKGAKRLYEWKEGSGLHYLGWVPGPTAEQVAEATASSINVVSEDGSRIFFMANRAVAGNVGDPAEVGKQGVFVREGGTHTVDVSASKTSTPDMGATYQGATPDGSRVYFTANAGLTSESSSTGTDLYEYDLETSTLKDLSVSAEPGGAAVNAVIGIAANGTHVYFTSAAQLVAGRGKTRAQNEGAGTVSLYDNAEGALHFVATVSRNIPPTGPANSGVLQANTSRVSPNGRYLVFEAAGNVTGYESGTVTQAYLYDADKVREPTICLSCRQDGAAPVTRAGSTRRLEEVSNRNPLYEPQSLVVRDGNPMVFFSSTDRLAPGGVPGSVNLYEWAHGQVFRIASEPAGAVLSITKSEVGLGGAAPNGEDLYFFDPAALNWENPEGRYAAWDARIGGGFAEPASGPPACDPTKEGSSSCHGPETAAPSAPTAGTTGFNGPGNVKPPHKKRPHKKHKRPHKKKGHKKSAKHRSTTSARNADRNRRAGK